MTRALGLFLLATLALGCSGEPQAKSPVPPIAVVKKPEKNEPPTEQELLQGIWTTEKWNAEGAPGWQCWLDIDAKGFEPPGIQLRIELKESSPNASGALVYALPAKLSKEGDKRSISLRPDAAKTSNLPAEIPYRLEEDQLIISIDEGPPRGEYRLRRFVKEKVLVPAR